MKKKSPWVSTAAVCEELGISSDHLYRLRADGTLKPGHHWKNIGRATAARATYRWHLQRCDDALSLPLENRSVNDQL
ncbi:hypothetical protein ACQ4M4_05250 [Leptolyngbya sp. AN02str]|uniref:hypothetical protein n=1 Tax=Leptolyngbya sp. AN02str TaxID=3423363 RepID=UPI003D30FE79